MAWLKLHGADSARPPLDKVIDSLKKDGVTDFAVVGYCFGGEYSFLKESHQLILKRIPRSPFCF